MQVSTLKINYAVFSSVSSFFSSIDGVSFSTFSFFSDFGLITPL